MPPLVTSPSTPAGAWMSRALARCRQRYVAVQRCRLWQQIRRQWPSLSGHRTEALDGKHLDGIAFIGAALTNGDLMQRKLADLNNAGVPMHSSGLVRRSSAPPRRRTWWCRRPGPVPLSLRQMNPRTARKPTYRFRRGRCADLRAGGDRHLRQHQRRFAPPPSRRMTKAGCCCPASISPVATSSSPVPGALADGTAFPAGATLSYDLPVKD